MGHPHLDGPDMPQIFFVAFDLLAIASIGIALQNKCFRLFLKKSGGGRYNFRAPKGVLRGPESYISPPRFFKNNLKHLQCHRLKEYIFHFFAFWLISCEP